MNYNGVINKIEAEAYNRQVRGNLLLNQISKIIEPGYHQKLSRYFLSSFDTISVETMESLYPAHPESLENKRAEIREFLNIIVVQQRNLQREIEDPWKEAEVMAYELMNDLRKEYHIE
jgi:hypothetical protein